MEPTELQQTLLVTPETPFAEIDSALRRLGLEYEDQQPTRRSILPGEPELASWSLGGRKPRVIYTFNPVVRLRVLDVATAPPALRGGIARSLPLLATDDLSEDLASNDPRTRLLGLWAAQATDSLTMLSRTRELLSDPDEVVAQQAASVSAHLEKVAAARLETRAGLERLAALAEPVIRQLGDREAVRRLCPTPADCANLVDAELAALVSEAVADLYRQPPMADPGEDYQELIVTAAPAGMLRWPNELSRKFPLGYRGIAGWLAAEHVWLTWAFQSPEGGLVRYDGLVWCDRWVWIPKPFRLVAPLLRELLAPLSPGAPASSDQRPARHPGRPT